MLLRTLRRTTLALALPLLSFTAPALAADKPTIGVVWPTLDAQFWNS